MWLGIWQLTITSMNLTLRSVEADEKRMTLIASASQVVCAPVWRKMVGWHLQIH